MHSLASFTQTSSGVVSSSFVSAIDVTSSLTMSENFQNSSLLGTENSLQLSLPVVSNAASLTGSVCNFSRASAPAVSSAWLLPSNSGTFLHPLMGSAYLYQHSSTAMFSGVPGQHQTPMAPASYPSMFQWDIMGGAEKKSSSLGDFTLTLIDQDTAAPPISMTAQYDTTSEINAMVPGYPSLSNRLVQGTPSQIINQEHTLSLPYQEENQVYYYDQNTVGPLLSGELGPYRPSYDSVSYSGSNVSAPQAEMVMVLKEVQRTNVLPSVSTTSIYYSVSTQPLTDTTLQVMETSQGMEASMGFKPPSQTFCLPQHPELPNSCSSRNIQNIQILESNPPTDIGDTSVITPGQTSTNFLALLPTQSQEQTESNSLDEIEAMLSKPLDAYQMEIENQDPPLLPVKIPYIQQLLASIGPLDQEGMPHSEHISLQNSSVSLEDKDTIENGIESNSGFADLTALVEDSQLPEVFLSLKDLDQPESPTIIKVNETRAIVVTQEQEKGVINGPSDAVRKNKRKASEPPDGPPKAKMHPQRPLEGGVACSDADSHRGPVKTSKHSNNSKPQNTAFSRSSKAKWNGQEKTKRIRENNCTKTEESKQPGKKVKAEEKPMAPKAKRKRHQPELSQESFKKPRSYLGMHMLESVQVFHALGKRNEKKTGLSSSRALGNSISTKDPCPCPAVKPWLGVNGPEKTQGKAQKPDISAQKECPPPSQNELPPPGKVKLVPLPFLSPEKPQPRPVCRRPQSLASRRPTGVHPAQPAPTGSAQSMAVKQFQPATANISVMGPAKPAQPVISTSVHSGLTACTRPSVLQSAASRPAPSRTSSCTSLQRNPLSNVVNKFQSQPPKPQNRYLLQDFAFQPIPSRKPNVPEPVMSTPITEEQRPEREAMKKKAQQERENVAKYTALGRVQYFIERERDMEIAHYYGYTI